MIPLHYKKPKGIVLKQQHDIDFENAVKTMMLHVGEDPDREGLLETPSRVKKHMNLFMVDIKKIQKLF